MKNIRNFFDEISRNLRSEECLGSPAQNYPYRSVETFDLNVLLNCRDGIFYNLSFMGEAERKIYALMVAEELEICLTRRLVDKLDFIEVVKYYNEERKMYLTLPKALADLSSINGKIEKQEVRLFESNEKYIEVSELVSALELFVVMTEQVFNRFSISLRSIAEENGIDLKYLKKDDHPFLPTILSDKQRELLYELLVGSFIPKETNNETFLYAFGSFNKRTSCVPIKWLKNKQTLRELLVPLIPKGINISTYKSLVAKVFVDEDGNPLTLANNKKVRSKESNAIANIHKKLATL
ncbi:hypothetical protein [Mangrovibacterium diazotrophicum]|uniref:Uncharacterized protein n=1 Tax=Mangrovibacterium diazotrophicum TaxID=1261403 RepID=A0A419WAT5_9BACT|nr:hypothetical protein [Mangrovibacterium diazotrophicum]RKD92534.1 hypothetical protein BC643_2908 [Mangrovibacterium diazotrophicum]